MNCFRKVLHKGKSMINTLLSGKSKPALSKRRTDARSLFPPRMLAAMVVLATPCVGAQTVAECTQEADNAHRLACYDRLFRGDREASAGGLPTAPIAPAEPAALAASSVAAAKQIDEPQTAPTAMTKFWELTPSDKRGTFVVRTYLPNFVLPLHYTSSINRVPSSPTQPASTRKTNYRRTEAKLQVSLRAKVAEDVLLPDADLWFAYTQQSLWQVWNEQDSSPFRSTDYQPEAIYVVPVPQQLGTFPGGWHWRMVQLGLAHQSNGQSDPLSRSWNRVYVGTAFERGEFGLQVRANHRLKESASSDNNPDLTRYIGNTEIMASWLPGRSTASLTWRHNLKSMRRGSLQLDLTHPVDSAKPAGLRWYLQVFTGYGETLLDYNHRQTSIGAGLTLFQF